MLSTAIHAGLRFAGPAADEQTALRAVVWHIIGGYLNEGQPVQRLKLAPHLAEELVGAQTELQRVEQWTPAEAEAELADSTQHLLAYDKQIEAQAQQRIELLSRLLPWAEFPGIHPHDTPEVQQLLAAVQSEVLHQIAWSRESLKGRPLGLPRTGEGYKADRIAGAQERVSRAEKALTEAEAKLRERQGRIDRYIAAFGEPPMGWDPDNYTLISF